MTHSDPCDVWLHQAWAELKAPLGHWPSGEPWPESTTEVMPALLQAVCRGDMAQARRLCQLNPPSIQKDHPGMAHAHPYLLPLVERIERDWQADRRSYTDTLYAFWNVQRLLQSLTDMGTPADPERATPSTWPAHRILMVAAPGCQHLLGVLVVADHFRAHGWQVQTLLDASTLALIQAVQDERPDVLGLSVGHDAGLQGVADLIQAIRHLAPRGCPRILMGGNIFTQSPHTYDWLGADGIATSAQHALTLCARWLQHQPH